jgi:para-aminobenzoate synthetase component 1
MLSITSLPYSSSLIENYHRLSHLPDFVLLDSGCKQRGRYDIVSAYPYDRISISADDQDFKNGFDNFRKRVQALQKPSHGELPFQGGAIGYVSYDFAAKMNGIYSLTHPLFKGVPILEFGFYDWAIITDHQAQTVSLINANLKPDTMNIIQEVLKLWHDPKPTSSFKLKNSFQPLIGKSQYESAFRAIHQDLRAGRAYQVNYSQPFLGEFSGDPWEMYKSIRAVNPVPYAAFLRCKEVDFLSFSPERFLLQNNDNILTSPIKGSIRRSSCADEDNKLKYWLAKSSKNKAENVMIVDLLRNDLGKIAIAGSVQVLNLCEVQSYNSVHHLVSNIEARCSSEHSSLDVFLACFPGGSITGAPKIEAMKIIQEQEQFSRGLYCGSIAYFSAHGRCDSNIAIRTVTASNNYLYLSAGGGIVIDSTCEEEFAECYTKIAAIVNQLNKSFHKTQNG